MKVIRSCNIYLISLFRNTTNYEKFEPDSIWFSSIFNPFPDHDPRNSDRMRDFDSETLFYLIPWFHLQKKNTLTSKACLFHFERSGNEMSLRSNEKWDFWGMLILWVRNSARTAIKKYYYLTPNFICSFIGIFHMVQIYYFMLLSLYLMIENVIKFVSCAMAVQRARAFSEYEYKFKVRI